MFHPTPALPPSRGEGELWQSRSGEGEVFAESIAGVTSAVQNDRGDRLSISVDLVSTMLDERARDLRNGMTEAEHVLWERIRRREIHGARFRRQVVLGNYIVDFVCLEARLIIELDGAQHTLQREYDARRTEWLESQNFRVVRFWNSDVMEDLDGVVEAIWHAVGAAPIASRRAGRGKRSKE